MRPMVFIAMAVESKCLILLSRKPKLPIEMDYQTKDDDLTPGDDPLDWNPAVLLQHARRMFELKERIYEKAGTNIKKAQEKDKKYYDRKHADPKVISACLSPV